MGSDLMNNRKIRSFRDIEDLCCPDDTIVTLCGGGLDSAYLLAQLAKLDVHVVALSVDVGDDFDIGQFSHIADKFDVHITRVDCRREFAEEFVHASMLAGGRYLGQHPISASLSRPLIARVGVELARSVGAKCLLHTANQSQNSLRRLNGAISDLGFDGYYGSPYEFDALSRDFKRLELQESFGISGFANRYLSTDTNLWCREFESGTLDDPEAFQIDENLYEWSVASETASRVIELRFDAGRLVSVDAEPVTDLVELISNINAKVGRYGIGRFSSLEHLEGGEKVLEVREAPAAALILEAFGQLASATLDVETLRWMRTLGDALIMEAVEGRWFRGLRTALQSFLEVSAHRVSGTVRFTLRNGGFELEGLKAVSPLYIRDREQWEYHKAAAARSVTLSRLNGSAVSTA
ncbi:argininosuccinate synthase-related protein [Mycolicibacterium arseniciresistens]|uniref:argininosuccinate synthase n=1 Tax=Mycolicibacterium arseniciresistens TaxID=3062257 RepID=A0ABT8ULL9_9MYCO|nr:argininosuccinate synthase-related protein [Mycolicibacterium arseniciresistens]MDO3637725.1 argininosuccinate synthase-related protein [Mycolicibacterium arseniciresistens]